MSDVRWDMLAQYPNPGQAFSQAFQEGQKQAEERRAKEAIAALVGNPDDPRAIEALAKIDPATAMQFKQQQAERALQQTSAFRETITKGAEMLRNLTSEDVPLPQAYSTVRQTLIANRFPGADQIPDQPDEQYIQGVMALADRDKTQTPRPVVIDGVAHDPRTGQPLFESPYDRIIQGPDGSFYRQPRIGIGRGGQVGQQPQGSVVNGELPKGWVYEDEGDAGGDASGGFRDPLAPL